MTNTGEHFQKAIVMSALACPRLKLIELPRCGGRFVGKDRLIRQPIPFDFFGSIHPAGRLICFDAKSLGDDYASFPLTNVEMVKPHQIAALRRMGAQGAIAGLLVESKRLAAYLWLSWEHLAGSARIGWEDERWIRLGGTELIVNFAMIPGVTEEPCPA